MNSARLTLAQARRVALAAQGFGRPRPALPTMRHVQGVIDQVAQFQIDSVNVAVRAQYMPLFARLGAYDRALLDRAASRAPRRLFEYWGHAAALIDVNLQPALRMRMRAYAAKPWASTAAILDAHPELSERVLETVSARGPLTPREIEDDEVRNKAHWGWNWSRVKHVLEHEFNTGQIAVAGRNAAFERRYDLASRVLPSVVLAQPDPSDADAHLTLVRRTARALGVADLGALKEYFYLKRPAVAAAVAHLERTGELTPVEIVGVPGQYWLWHEARVPRRLDVQALISPFDSFAFYRPRLLELFGTHYRIEIYTPAAHRQYGYYVYLFLHGEQMAARVDLKADRGAGVLIVQSAWLEAGARAEPVADALASELQTMATWLGLQNVKATGAGTLGANLSAAL